MVARVGLLLLVCIPVRVHAYEGTVSEQVHAVGLDIGNVENGIRRLERDVENPVAQSRFYSLEKRLVDGRVFFELENYANAAVLYMDAIGHETLLQHPERPAVLFRLAYSLYRLRNFGAARKYFQELTRASSGDYYAKGVRYLIDLGLEAPNADGLSAAVRLAESVSPRPPDLQFAFGKGLFQLGRTQEALIALSQVAEGADQYRAAQYYTGVVLTERQQYAEAITAFERAIANEATTDAQKLVRELSFLAIGRLYLEIGKYPQAVNAYQEVPRHSEHFHTALYEMSWAHANGENYEQALNALDVLLLTIEDEQLATQATILRGRLNIMLDQSDIAVDTYTEVVNRFTPLRDEISTFASRHDNLVGYFRWLLNRHADTFQLGVVMSQRASAWIERDEQLRDVVAVFDDMSLQRRDVVESRQILQSLDQALAAGNRVEIFPNMKQAWLKVVTYENQLIQLSQVVLDLEGGLARTQMSTSEQQQLDALVAQRRTLEARFEQMPKSVDEFNARNDTVHQRYAALKREAFHLSDGLTEARVSLQAMEEWITNSRYNNNTEGQQLSPEQVEQITAEVEQEKTRLRALKDELDALNQRIEQENIAVGAGDLVSEEENALRKRLLDAHRAEEALLHGVLNRLAGQERQNGDALRGLRARVVQDFGRLGRLLNGINEAVDAKVADYRRQLDAERQLLAGYQAEVHSFEQNTDRFAREIGIPLFQLAHERLDQVVLEADLGLVDVAWRRKMTETDRIRGLQDERSEQVRDLQTTLEEILKN